MTLLLILTLGLGVVTARAEQGSASARQWDFEDAQENRAPLGFSFARTGSGRLGRWVVTAETDAPSGSHVLAQLDADATDFRFPIAVANEPLLTDLRLSVKCKPVSGDVDRACGSVFRYQDENNSYLTRANALEQNVRLYKMINGHRQQLAIGLWTKARSVIRDRGAGPERYQQRNHPSASWNVHAQPAPTSMAKLR